MIKTRSSRKIRDMAIFAMLGALMFASKIVMEILPNIHLLGMLTMIYTIAYRMRALIPIYIYVVINGVYAGFSLWWMPYTYIWTLLWGATMLLPKNMPLKAKYVVYPTVCALHGFLYGTLYAPAQALMFGLDLSGMLAWIVAGFPFDIIHGVSNIFMGLLVYPLSQLLTKLDKGKY